MYNPIQLTTTVPSVRTSLSRSPLRRGSLLIPLALACFALSPTVRAVTPAPDGGYPSGNTAEGEDARAHVPLRVRTNWVQAEFDAEHTVHNKYENVLNPSNVGRLELAWTAQVIGGFI